VQNGLQSIALNRGLRLRHRLWSQHGLEQLERLPAQPHNARRRSELLALYHHLDERIGELDGEVERQADTRERARRLRTHPGVGPVTALATDLIIGPTDRFRCPHQVGSYAGLIPSAYSSGGKQRHGHLSKQGNPLLRFLWIEAGLAAVRGRRRDDQLARLFRRLVARKGLGIAAAAVGRKLGERLYIMLRDEIDYEQFLRRGAQRGGAHAAMAD
jgi:transposase